MKIVFLDALTIGRDIDLSLYEKYGELKVYETTTQEEFTDHVGDSDVIIINKLKVGRQNLPKCPNVKLVCVTATGFDNIDTEYCKENGIAVCNVVGYSTQNVAQLTVAMVLSLYCRLTEYNRSVTDGTYTRGGVANILTPVYHELYGKTWGIVGYGGIGKAVARIARGLGARVIVNKRTPVDGVECVDIDTICRESDVITLHCPLNGETRGLISKEKIDLMKPSVIIVNEARGAVVVEADIRDAILNERIAGYGCDVYSAEPFDASHPYNDIMQLDNVILTPHAAWGAYEARARCLDIIIKNIKTYEEGNSLNRVDK